jgi:hypothetical protein
MEKLHRSPMFHPELKELTQDVTTTALTAIKGGRKLCVAHYYAVPAKWVDQGSSVTSNVD